VNPLQGSDLVEEAIVAGVATLFIRQLGVREKTEDP
jgi:hypothetical protein